MGSKKEKLIYETTQYKMFETTLEGSNATKFFYKESVKQFNLLKNIHHDNLIRPTKIVTKSNVFYTMTLIPFSHVYKDTTKMFNLHIFLCLAKSIDFLHKKCKILHNNIETDSLFFTEEGKLVLGGFEKAKIADCFDTDFIQFSNLLQKHLKISTNLQSFLKEHNEKSNYFYNNEIFFFGFNAHSLETKKEFIRDVKKHKLEFIGIYKQKIINVFINDLNKDFDKFYKEDILNMIFALDTNTYDNTLVTLLNILDSNVRLFLFENSQLYMNKITSLDRSIDSILLGLKIKKNDLKKQTILFLQENAQKISAMSHLKILESIFEYITDTSDIFLVIKYLNNVNFEFTSKECGLASKDISDEKIALKRSDLIYKICKKYLTIPSCRSETFRLIRKFYPIFNKHKLSTELLPLICTYLASEDLQSFVFLLIEEILLDLKSHKEKILSKEWSLVDFFKSKVDKNKSCENISEMIKNDFRTNIESEDDWDDDW